MPDHNYPAPFDIESFRRLLLAREVLHSRSATLTPLTGGVSSDIFRADDNGRVFVVKRALAKLRVEADWFANPARNAHEQAYIAYIARFRPDAVPRIVAEGKADGFFAMEFLEGFTNWKTALLAGEANPSIAARAAGILGEIHASSWHDPVAAERFDTTAHFRELRIDPYFIATAVKHPDLQAFILTDAETLAATRVALVHGDYSPKNLLFHGDRLVALDCEVAWFGDPSFDVAFLLNHILLKALFHVPTPFAGRALFDTIIAAYTAANIHADDVLGRTPRILRWLLLARVDGKSPVEYLPAAKKAFVREFVRKYTVQADGTAPTLAILANTWFESLASLEAPPPSDRA